MLNKYIEIYHIINFLRMGDASYCRDQHIQHNRQIPQTVALSKVKQSAC